MYGILLRGLQLGFYLREILRNFIDFAFRFLHLKHFEPRRGLAYVARQLTLLVYPHSRPEVKPPSIQRKPPPPTEVGIIVVDSEEAIKCMHQIASVLLWCVEAGIRRVALYDPAGVYSQRTSDIVAHVESLQSNAANPCRLDLGTSADASFSTQAPTAATPSTACTPSRGPSSVTRRRDSRVDTQAESSSDPEGVSNREPGPLLRLDILSAQQTWKLMAQEMIMESDPNSHRHKTQSMSSVWKALSSPCEARGLELVMVFGRTLTLAGFPPWLTHLCEVLHLGPLQNIRTRRLRASFKKYASVTQRFGT